MPNINNYNILIISELTDNGQIDAFSRYYYWI